MDEEKILNEVRELTKSAERKTSQGLVYTCQNCKVTFIGPRAVYMWSEHTWVHWEEEKSL